MKHLTIVRHAKSSWDDPNSPDHERVLNARGERDAPRMGEWLSQQGENYDALLASPASRAHQTALHFCEALGVDEEELILAEELYTFDGSALIECIRSLDPSWSRVILFGHNPAVTEVVNALCDADIGNIPTCGVSLIQLPTERWDGVHTGWGELLSFCTPKRLSDDGATS